MTKHQFDFDTVANECVAVCAMVFAGFMPCEVADVRKALGIRPSSIFMTRFDGEKKIIMLSEINPKTHGERSLFQNVTAR